MTDTTPVDTTPTVRLALELHPSLSALGGRDDLTDLLTSELQQLLQDLGLPGRAAVDCTIGTPGPGHGSWARIAIDGRACGVPAAVVTLVRELIDADPSDPRQHVRAISTVEWLQRLVDDPSPRAAEHARRFCALGVHAAVTARPSVLLTPDVEAAYAERLAPRTARKNLRAVLRAALDARLSVADTVAVEEALAADDPGPEEGRHAVESLIARLRPDELVVSLPADHLREVTVGAGEEGRGILAYLRHGLLDEVGLLFPRVRLHTDDALPPRSFAVTLNHLRGVPLAGLASGEILVNEAPDRLGVIDVPVIRDVLNPANHTPNAVVPASERARVEAMGLTVWSPLAFVILGVAAELRRHASCFVDRRSVAERISAEAELRPATFRQLDDLVDRDVVVQTVRGLVRDTVPVLRLHEIAERLLDAAVDPPTDLLQYVREGIPRTMTARFAGRFRTFRAYLLDPDLEQELRAQPGAATHEAILETVRTEVSTLPEGVSVPGIIAPRDIREGLQQIVASEFPRLPVLTFAELPPDVLVQPIARLSRADGAAALPER